MSYQYLRTFFCSTLRSMMVLAMLIVSNLTYSDAVDLDSKKISIVLQQEPPSLNSLLASDQVSFFVLEHVMEGLLALDHNSKLIPGIAYDWEISTSGATFRLRKDALWSDGVPVRASDFVFAWRRLVDPSTASRYAFIMSPIKNAEQINAGKLDPKALGVYAPDDYTLVVKFERPCPYFLSLTTFVSYYPVREDLYRQAPNKYFSSIKHMVFNGPYILTEWVHGSSMRFVKNKNFWNQERIQINEIDVPYISSDPNVSFNLFRNNEVVYSDLKRGSIKSALQEHMHIKSFKVGALEYINFNHRKDRISHNKHLRKAMQLVFDPNEMVYKVIGIPGNKPSYSLFPSWLKGAESSFQKEYPARIKTVDHQKALKHLELAKQELGLVDLPPIVLLTSDIPGSLKKAEYLQALFKDALGLEIKIDKQIFKQRLAKMREGEFDIALAAWGPDYDDPSTFSDLFYSKNSNNYGLFIDKEYDHWTDLARNSTDIDQRMKAFAKMQDIVTEQVIVLPYLERGIVYVQHPKLRGMARRIFGGDPSFRYAHIEPNQGP